MHGVACSPDMDCSSFGLIGWRAQTAPTADHNVDRGAIFECTVVIVTLRVS